MMLLNSAANLGGTWHASVVMLLIGRLTVPPDCSVGRSCGCEEEEVCTGVCVVQLCVCVLNVFVRILFLYSKKQLSMYVCERWCF